MILYGDSKYENKVNKNILLASVNFVLSTRRFEDQLMWRSLHGKSYFCFSRRPEKIVFPNNSRWNVNFFVSSGKMIFLFPENMILPQTENEGWSFSKNTRKYDIFFKCSEKMVFSKRIALGYDLSCTIWKGGVFFPRKQGIFSLDGKWQGWSFSRNTRKHDIFYLICSTPPPPPPYPATIHLKVIDVLNRYLRKSSSNSVYFHEDLYRRFHILLSSEKNRKLNI